MTQTLQPDPEGDDTRDLIKIVCPHCRDPYWAHARDMTVWLVPETAFAYASYWWIAVCSNCVGRIVYTCYPQIAEQLVQTGATLVSSLEPPEFSSPYRPPRGTGENPIVADEVLDFHLAVSRATSEEIWEAVVSGT